MQVSRYHSVIYLQVLLLIADLIINAFSLLLDVEKIVLLVIFIIQDVCLVFALIVLFLVFFNTYVFQAGLVYLLVRKFKATILIMISYLALSASLHAWTMTRLWPNPKDFIWIDSFQALFVIQRTVAVIYYHLYKKSIIKLCDPRYYTDSQWLRNEFAMAH